MFEHLVESYGYLALFFGTLLEGETILVIGGFLAHRGYLTLPGVMLVAFAGSLLGDTLFFFLGRSRGEGALAEWPKLRQRLAKAQGFLNRNRTLLILSFRFLYGLRTVLPFALGTTRISFARFALLNAAGAALWSVVFTLLGYLFGELAKRMLVKLERFELLLVALIAVIGLCIWLFGRWRRQKET